MITVKDFTKLPPEDKLASCRHGYVVVYKNLVGKVFLPEYSIHAVEEAENLVFANQINGLMVKFYDKLEDSHGNSMLLMERLYPLAFRAFNMREIKTWLAKFRSDLEQLHNAGFVFNDIDKTICLSPGEPWYNYMITRKGYRLVDTGISVLKHKVSAEVFTNLCNSEIGDFKRLQARLLGYEL